MDRGGEVRRNGWVDVLVFCLAQAIVSENGFIGGGEGEVMEKGESCLHLFTMRSCARVNALSLQPR
jgi:hypothetical protein